MGVLQNVIKDEVCHRDIFDAMSLTLGLFTNNQGINTNMG